MPLIPFRQQCRTEVNRPSVLILLCEADALPDQGTPDADLLSLPADGSTALDAADMVVIGVRDPGEASWAGLGRGLIDRCRRILPQRFMRPMMIEILLEVIKGALLATGIGLRGRDAVVFECEMHPFMPWVLFRVAGCDPFRDDTQFDPGDRQA